MHVKSWWERLANGMDEPDRDLRDPRGPDAGPARAFCRSLMSYVAMLLPRGFCVLAVVLDKVLAVQNSPV